jgi:PAS domain S-box-containing protein
MLSASREQPDSATNPGDGTIAVSAEEYRRLQESERMLATLYSNLPGMAYRCVNAPGWPFEVVSRGCEELTGYPANVLTSGRITWDELISPERLDEVERETWDAVREGRPYQFIYPLVTASGARRWVWEQGEGIVSADGRTEAIEGFITDVTERMQAWERLEVRVAERTRELETLLEVSRSVVALQSRDAAFEAIFDQLSRVVHFNGASVGLVEGAELTMIAIRRDGTFTAPSSVGHRFPIVPDDAIWSPLRQGRPVITPDVRGDDPVARAYRHSVGELPGTLFAHVRSWMAAPLMVNDEMIGGLFLSSTASDSYTAHHAELVMAMANHAAIAIENARLHDQSRMVAVLEERQRLARELHDSVTQALFGISLHAETAQARMGHDPARAARSLDYVVELAQTGMAEMRALLFELRPESLEQEGLVAAIEKQAAALRARHHIAVETDLGPEPDVPLPAKEALYRIAQEAMQNTIKHAEATTMRLRLHASATTVVLEVADDGKGFDAPAPVPGHIGLRSMPERAQRLGGACEIRSVAGGGTIVRASIPRGQAP